MTLQFKLRLEIINILLNGNRSIWPLAVIGDGKNTLDLFLFLSLQITARGHLDM